MLSLMKETAKIRKIITKRGTMEILIRLCCCIEPVSYNQFYAITEGI